MREQETHKMSKYSFAVEALSFFGLSFLSLSLFETFSSHKCAIVCVIPIVWIVIMASFAYAVVVLVPPRGPSARVPAFPHSAPPREEDCVPSLLMMMTTTTTWQPAKAFV